MARKSSICDYCMMTMQTDPSTCQACKKTFCMYHASQENHHCDAVDWQGIKKTKYDESEARFNRVMKRVAFERSVKTLFTIIGGLILIGLVWVYIVPAIKDLDFSRIQVFNTTPMPEEHNISILVFQYTNEERTKHNLSTFDSDPKLEAAAEWQSECLSMNNILEHETEQCGTLEGRYGQFGVVYLAAGENLASDWDARSYYEGSNTPTGYMTSEEVAHAIVDGWMNSPRHRENILDGDYGRMGIGVYYNRTTHRIITTQNFAN